MEREDEFLRRNLQKKLSSYYFLDDDYKVSLLKYSENYNWLIESRDKKYVLRQCRPGYHTYEELNGELLWIEELRKTTDILMPDILENKDGNFLTDIDGYICTMFSFLEGTTLRGIDGEKLLFYLGKIGEIAAKLHIESINRDNSIKLKRFSWNYDDLLGKSSRVGNWRQHSGLTERQKNCFEKAEKLIYEKLNAYGKGSEKYGLIHSDLNINNVLVEGEKVQIIDFDDCGYGWFLYDLSTTVLEYDTEIMKKIEAWVHGYEKYRKFTEEDKEMIPTFIVMRKIVRIGWIASHMENDTVKKVAADYYEQTAEMAEKYINSHGKEFCDGWNI